MRTAVRPHTFDRRGPRETVDPSTRRAIRLRPGAHRLLDGLCDRVSRLSRSAQSQRSAMSSASAITHPNPFQGARFKMKNLALVGLVTLCGWYLTSCQAPKGGETGPVHNAYQCPSCKETVKWRYNPQKPWIKEGKEVIHVCPDCQ